MLDALSVHQTTGICEVLSGVLLRTCGWSICHASQLTGWWTDMGWLDWDAHGGAIDVVACQLH